MSENMIASEVWKPIPLLDGRYEATADGLIRNRRTGNILNPWKVSNGYWRVQVWLNGIDTHRAVHVLVADAFLGPSNGMEVNHKDGDKANNHVRNLEYVTHQANMQHASRLGLLTIPDNRGERCGTAKLTETQVREIRTLAGVVPQKDLCRRFGISTGQMSRIVTRQRWAHVE